MKYWKIEVFLEDNPILAADNQDKVPPYLTKEEILNEIKADISEGVEIKLCNVKELTEEVYRKETNANTN